MEHNIKELKIRYKFDDNGCINFIDPCCDEIPAHLFCHILSALNNVQKEYNESIVNNNKHGEIIKNGIWYDLYDKKHVMPKTTPDNTVLMLLLDNDVSVYSDSNWADQYPYNGVMKWMLVAK